MDWRRRGRLTGISFAVALLVLVSGPLAGLRAQDEQFRERQILDPNADDWKDETPPAPGTPEATLDTARSLLARGEARQARRLLSKWIEQHPDHDRYLEGVYLYAESCFETRDYYRAYEHYEVVAESGSGDLFQRAVRREIDCARAFLAGQKRIVWRIFRLPAYDDGVEILDRVWERVPGTRIGETVLRLKADHFFNSGDMDLAQDEYVNLAREYPSGRFIRVAMLRSAEAADASFPGVPFDDRALVDADERYRAVKATFPDYAAREAVDARLQGIREKRAEKDLYVGRYYEKVKQPGAAEFYYRQLLKDWPETLAAADARTRLRALGATVDEPAAPAGSQPAGERGRR
jgi:outer membrane protein assembly factor BamD (BamD/ComL family)